MKTSVTPKSMAVQLLPKLVWSCTLNFTVFPLKDKTFMMTNITNPGVMLLRSDIYATFSCGVAKNMRFYIVLCHNFSYSILICFIASNISQYIKCTCMLVH